MPNPATSSDDDQEQTRSLDEEELIAPEVFFIAGRDPAWLNDQLSDTCLHKLGEAGLWLTLGVFSLIAVSNYQDVSDELVAVLGKQKITYERWKSSDVEPDGQYFGEAIEYVNPTELEQGGVTPNSTLINDLKGLASTRADDTLGFMILELCTLLSVAHSRSVYSFPEIADDCEKMEDIASELLNLISAEGGEKQTSYDAMMRSRLGLPSRQDILLTLNAGLSRMVSQAFSGTSPILRTECHFWPHSFLGIGVASMALRNVSNFVSESVERSGFDYAVKTHLATDL